MVNINIEVPDDIHKQAKIAAIKNEKTLKEHIIERIEEGLRRLER